MSLQHHLFSSPRTKIGSGKGADDLSEGYEATIWVVKGLGGGQGASEKSRNRPLKAGLTSQFFVWKIFGLGSHQPGVGPFLNAVDGVTKEIGNRGGTVHITVRGVPSALRVSVLE
jgi:hypothetical protein